MSRVLVLSSPGRLPWLMYQVVKGQMVHHHLLQNWISDPVDLLLVKLSPCLNLETTLFVLLHWTLHFLNIIFVWIAQIHQSDKTSFSHILSNTEFSQSKICFTVFRGSTRCNLVEIYQLPVFREVSCILDVEATKSSKTNTHISTKLHDIISNP